MEFGDPVTEGVDGRSFEVFSDVVVDRDGRCQKALCDCSHRQCRWSEPVTYHARYGLLGVRVREASHPGPPRRRERDGSEDSADSVVTSLGAALVHIDDSDGESQARCSDVER